MTDETMPGNLPVDHEPPKGPIPSPTIGRMVIIVDTADGKHHPAVVRDRLSEDGEIEAFVFGPKGATYCWFGRYSDDLKPGTWHWPPRG